MQLRYSYRLYPTPGQQHALARAFGCARVGAIGGRLGAVDTSGDVLAAIPYTYTVG